MADGESSDKKMSPLEVYRRDGFTPEILLTVALVLVARRWRALIDDELRPLGHSSARMEALSAIMNSPDPSSQVVIANRLRIEGPTMTRMIDALSRDGLVERRTGPSDRRTKYLHLTKNGEAALEQIFDAVEPLRVRLLDGLTREEMDGMQQVLTKMLHRLDAGLPPSDPDEDDAADKA